MIGQTLAHYRITAAIGAGGMGEVYRATDTKLGREVALKVLPTAMASSPERLERFRREAKALAALDHPGVVGVYSVEEADGVHFLTMQLVEGRSLDQLIPTGGMDVPRILVIATALADALAAAHDKGIVHRDLKPANIMVAGDGRVKVLDFGLAKITDSGGDEGEGSELPTGMKTREGVVMGTVPYMSPEQVRGQTVDQRTDIFSFGVILYELATGRRPFQGRSSAELASAILRDAPQPPGEVRASLPDGLGRVIGRCLEKNAADRFQSARDLRDALRGVTVAAPSTGNELIGVGGPALRSATGTASGAAPVGERSKGAIRPGRLVLAGLVLVILVAAGSWLMKRGAAGEHDAAPGMTDSHDAASEMTLAVLPIENLGGNSATEYLADGMTGDLSNALKKLPGLQVAGDLSTFRFKGTHTAPADIARQLGVRMLLTGKLQPGKDRVRLQMQLSRPDGKLVWSNTYDRENKDNFAMQDEITAAIASEMRLVLSPTTIAMTRAGRTVNPEAHDLFMRGQFEKNKVTPQGLARALVYFQDALKLDPHYAQAHAGIAFVYDMLADVYKPSHEYHTLALAAARKAVESDDLLAEAHALYGYELAAAQWDFAAGRVEMDRGLALDPNSPDVLFLGGTISFLSGDSGRAVAMADRLIQIDPLSPLAARLRAEALLWGGRYEEALTQHQVANRLDPTVVLIDATDGNALRELGRYDESVAAFLNFEKSFDLPSFGLPITYARMGRKEDAMRAIHALEERARKQWVDPDLIAIAYAGVGDRDQAMKWLEKAFRIKAFGLRLFLNGDCPWLRSMHDDPRFIALRQRVLATTFKS